jgi:hypothetical protein
MNWLRDFAVILLAIEIFVIALVPLMLFGGLVYGLWWLQRHENLPSWLRLAQAYLSLGQAYVELAMLTVIRPILRIHATLATVRSWLGGIVGFARGRQ